MANAKISAWTASTTAPAETDAFPTVESMGGTPAHKRKAWSVLREALGALNGWINPNQTWTYASATTITVPSGAASIYAVGTKIKLTQTTVKYFYVIGVADTVLTVVGNGAVVVTNAAISANYYSNATSPVGFPTWFSWGPPTITWTAGTAPSGSPSTVEFNFAIVGNMCHISIFVTPYTAGATVTAASIPLPVICAKFGGASGHIGVSSAVNLTNALFSTADTLNIACTSVSATRLWASGSYEIG
jgi:hypothetical protein